MAYNNSIAEQMDYNYQYPNYYTSDGSTAGGEESNFWSNSPRSDSPSPNHQIIQNIGGSYQLFTPVGCSTPAHRYTPFRNNNFETITDAPTHVPFLRVVKRRTTANKKERRRTQSINNAYADLRDCIPNVPSDTKLSKNSINNAYADLKQCIPNVPSDTKLSKIKTLRLATSYISYLTRALETDDTAGGFKAELGSISRKSSCNNQVQVNDFPTGQVSPKSDSSEDMNNSRKAKGRTGWPQHVWALELKQEQL